MLCVLLVARAGALVVPRRSYARGTALRMARSDVALKEGIAAFYDESSGIWEDVWGEHMHHGWYAPGEKATTREAHVKAQDTMIEKALALCGADAVAAECAARGRPFRVVDVGCGIGGASRYIARKYEGAECVGLTLSPAQAARGNEISEAAGLDVTLRCEDATNSSLASGAYDLVWSMESGEHMPDKRRFVDELGRLCAPGGCVSLVTWCHRDLDAAATLKKRERAVLGLINACYYLPAWCSGATYEGLFAEKKSFKPARVEDWTGRIAPFWPAVLKSSLTLSSLRKLAGTGVKTVRGAVAIGLMILGYKIGTVKFVALAANKE